MNRSEKVSSLWERRGGEISLESLLMKIPNLSLHFASIVAYSLEFVMFGNELKIIQHVRKNFIARIKYLWTTQWCFCKAFSFWLALGFAVNWNVVFKQCFKFFQFTKS